METNDSLLAASGEKGIKGQDPISFACYYSSLMPLEYFINTNYEMRSFLFTIPSMSSIAEPGISIFVVPFSPSAV